MYRVASALILGAILSGTAACGSGTAQENRGAEKDHRRALINTREARVGRAKRPGRCVTLWRRNDAGDLKCFLEMHSRRSADDLSGPMGGLPR